MSTDINKFHKYIFCTCGITKCNKYMILTKKTCPKCGARNKYHLIIMHMNDDEFGDYECPKCGKDIDLYWACKNPICH